MASGKIGPWRSEDWQDFLALDVELRPASTGTNALASLLNSNGIGLLGLGGLGQLRRNDDQAKLVEAAWDARRAHPVYRTLAADPNFRQAWSVFERRRRAAKQGKLTSATAPFMFLRDFVRYAGFGYQLRGGTADRTYGPHAKRRRAAAKYADALIDLLAVGVSLEDYSDTEALRTLLPKLSQQMKATKRKSYGGKRDTERWVLKGLAHSLVVDCELQSPTLLTHFARMLGLACESKMAQRYCAEAGRRWRQLLAETLRRHAAEQGQKPSAI